MGNPRIDVVDRGFFLSLRRDRPGR